MTMKTFIVKRRTWLYQHVSHGFHYHMMLTWCGPCWLRRLSLSGLANVRDNNTCWWRCLSHTPSHYLPFPQPTWGRRGYTARNNSYVTRSAGTTQTIPNYVLSLLHFPEKSQQCFGPRFPLTPASASWPALVLLCVALQGVLSLRS